ncbi:hypothetical protein ABMA28_004105 [Loxostege sticticalis]|uniref:Integrase catalytic domain-containing protein n=1 Tax=Loxostege sticticalis TaxID=481309 RepID=A0ABD0SV86_LOXSC
MKNIEVPRCYPHYTNAETREIHVFVDASEAAYAAAVYWRVTTPHGDISVSLAAAKAKVAPLKLTSIPRLELQAAVLGSRLAAAVIDEHDLKPTRKFYWTDSRTVLTWLKTGARSYRPFVAHRIAAIEENSAVSEWRWVPTKHNVADDATRDVPEDLTSQHRWFQGPAFLREDEASWPADTSVTRDNKDTGEEKVSAVNLVRDKNSDNAVVPDPSRFSRYERLLRATARVLQFIELCRSKRECTNYSCTRKNKCKDPEWKTVKNPPEKRPSRKCSAPITEDRLIVINSKLLNRAETLLVKKCQADSFSDEIDTLRKGADLPRKNRFGNVAIELVSDILCVKPRINAASDVSAVTKRPIVLDGRHRIARLYIDYVHRKLHHAGVEATISECRTRFWVLRLRTTARSIVHQCLPCRARRNTPPAPPTGDLPACRLAHHRRPFSYTGVDYFGPLTVTVGRSTQKRYVALFTCLTTRAVHLEVAESLTTDSAVMALRRMIARRGCPAEIWSDNGTNLRGADRELREAANHILEREAAQRRISWRFLPPGAPFMGGAWERLVRSVKTALAAVLQERSPREEVLATLLAEVENTVNSRPLTHVSTDPDDPEPLTPNHFLLHGPSSEPALGTFDDSDLIGRTHWRASQRLADLFWTRWLQEYLPELQHRREPHGRGPPLKLEDLVIIVDNSLPRNTWPRGVVTAVYPGPDGIVRTADVQTRGGVLRRPTKKLIVLPKEVAALPANEDCIALEDEARRENVQDGHLITPN